MGAIGIVFVIVGFIVGNYAGYMLSNAKAVKDASGVVIKSKQTLYTGIIAASAVLILAGQYIYTSSYSY